MKSAVKQKYSIVDLFAGAGGLSYGFLQTGRFEVKAAFENNRNAQQTYKHNHGDAVVYDDVVDALTDEIKQSLGQIDVVIGGPPCQGFSNANRQKNHAISQNNSLIKKFVKAIIHLSPSAFLMENVSMLQSDVHLFYVSEDDTQDIKDYNIKTKAAEIVLLDADYIFEGAGEIAADPVVIEQYLWDEADYLVLNIIYKKLKSYEKLRDDNASKKSSENKENLKKALDKLIKSLNKYQKELFALSAKLIERPENQHHIFESDHHAGEAIQTYFLEKAEISTIPNLCTSIETSIMIQRMLGKAKEIIENGIVVTKYTAENGLVAHVTSMAVIDYIHSILGSDLNGYKIDQGVLSAAEFGAPQKRMRFVVMGVKETLSKTIELPKGSFKEGGFRTVYDAISDLECIVARTEMTEDKTGIELPPVPDGISELGKTLRNSTSLKNHISTATTPEALKRFKAIKQGENFHDLPDDLKTTYSDSKRTQNTIYLRLKYDEPSGTVVNVRKSMWIHPVLHRALSIREAARLQTFPDSFVFCGTKDSQYQQVGNAVPPILAKAIAEHLCGYLDK